MKQTTSTSLITTCAIALFMLIANLSRAQQPAATTQNSQRTGTQTAESPEHAKKPAKDKEFEDRMAKFDQTYNKLKQKEAKTKDPEMKADLNTMLSKMDKAKSDYDAMQNMPPEQQKAAKENLHKEMQDIKKMEEEMKAKYSDKKKGAKEPKQQPQHAAPAEGTNQK